METMERNKEKMKVQQWRAINDVMDEVPEYLQQAISHKDSMTAFIKQQGRFRLELMCHDWQQPWLDEVRYLHVPNQQFIVREVLLGCDEFDFIYARAVIPEATMRGRGEALRNLRGESLGNLLFQDPELKRSEFEIKKLAPQDLLFKKAMANSADESPDDLWARRSIFQFYNNPLLLTEVFYDLEELLGPES